MARLRFVSGVAAVLLVVLVPSAAFGAVPSGTSAHPAPLDPSGEYDVAAQGFSFVVTGALNGMTYYEPVTLQMLSANGPIDIPPGLEFRLDGMRVYSGHVVYAIGTHTLVMSGSSNGVPYSSSMTFTIAAPPEPWLKPVFRFYRPSLGTHFYTNSHSERDSVIVRLGGTYAYEGVAYWTDLDYDVDPLYRFYRPSTGTHFYTADESEKLDVQSRLASVYIFEGTAYTVTRSPATGAAPVWRFYNVRNGTHFYTGSEAEKAAVQANLGAVYLYEGAAFWVGE